MINFTLNKYNPKDKNTHNILRFFAEDLDEADKIKFIEAIFNRGSWVLPTEIFKLSELNSLKGYTEDKFYKIFNDWVDERIKHNSFIYVNSKHPFIPHQLFFDYTEALFSIKNLGFPSKLLSTFERLLKNCRLSYIKRFYENSFNLVIENFDEKEIEVFFGHFFEVYINDKSINLKEFLYVFLDRLAYSHKIFNLSSSFIDKLNSLSNSFQKEDYKNDFFLIISILQIELITQKKLDLNDSKFNDLIKETIIELQNGNISNLKFLKFLKKFNYSFDGYDVNVELIGFLEGIQNNINRIKTDVSIDKKVIITHFIKDSDRYFELLLFYLSIVNREFSKEILSMFIKLIDEVRSTFSSSLLWLDEFINFKTIPGEIYAFDDPGFEVKVEESFFSKKLKEMHIEFNLEKDITKYGSGFVHKRNLKDYGKVYELFQKNKKKKLINRENLLVDNSEIEGPDSFLIEALNYSSFNKGNVIKFIPAEEEVIKIITKYQLKALFSSLEIFLIKKGAEFLKNESPIQIKSSSFRRMFAHNYDDDYNFNLSQEDFWAIIKELRPQLYEQIYIFPKKEERSFLELVKAYENETILKGVVKSRTKGGMFVDINDSIAFLPGSQIDVMPIRDYDQYLEKTMDFKVVKVVYEFKNVVVSHKAVIERDIEEQKKETIAQLEKGQVLEGVVKNITGYGVFVDIGGVDGLIHRKEVSWARFDNLREIFDIGERLRVVILDFESDKSRIQLGLKQLSSHPWESFDEKLKVGDKINGKVLKIVGYGVFVEIAPGIEGLIHVTDMAWGRIPDDNKLRLAYIEQFFNKGDVVESIILTLQIEERKISLGLKQLSEDPWIRIIERYPVGSVHSGTVVNLRNFGVFVELEPAIDGLIYISDLSWTMKIEHPSEFVNIGDKLDVVVLGLDAEGRKLSLGHKQTKNHPWDKYKIEFAIGTTHNLVISQIVDKGALVKLNEFIDIFIPTIRLFKNNGKMLKKGEAADFTIMIFDKSKKNLVAFHNSPNIIKFGSKVWLEPKDKTPKWFCVGKHSTDCEKIDKDGSLALKLLNKKAGDFINLGNGFKVLLVL